MTATSSTKPSRPFAVILPIIWVGLLVSALIAFFIAQVPMLGITMLALFIMGIAFHKAILERLYPHT